VYDDKGQKRGFFAIDYLGESLINRFQTFVPAFRHRFRLLNSEGFWMKAANPSDEWGFAFENRNQKTVARTDPALWTEILTNDQGQLARGNGVFTWRRLAVPRLIAGETSSPTAMTDDAFFVIGAETSRDELNEAVTPLRKSFAVMGAVVLGLIFFGGWFFRSGRVAKEKLRETEFRLRLLIESVKDYAIVMLDPEGRVVTWNTGAEHIIGYTADEIVGRHVSTFYPAEAIGEGRPEMEIKAARTLGNFEDEGPRLRKDHSEFWANVVVSPIRDDKGRLLGFSKVVRDLTERKKSERILAESEARFRGIFESVPVSVWVADCSDLFPLLDHVRNEAKADWVGWLQRHPEFVDQLASAVTIMDVNSVTLRMFGATSKEQILGSLKSIFRTREMRQRFIAELAALERGESFFEHETMVRRLDGTPIYLLQTLAFPTSRTHARVLVSSIDITARKTNEETIRQLNEHLRAQNEQLQVVNQELESFSYSVSHDLRAPVRHIDGFANLLEKHVSSGLDDQARRYLSTITKSAKQMGKLIDDLLAFSRVGREQMVFSDVDMRSMVNSVINDGRFSETGQPITWTIGPLPHVHADAAMLRQVWVNLIGNAVKYSSKNPSPKIEINTTTPTKPGEAVFFIRDNGVGFDMNYAVKLFGVFQRLHSSTEFPGTGIGLANVRRIIARYGGRTWAEGRVGEGATFYFSLPTLAPSEPASYSPADESDAGLANFVI
jgi:PAS domain S-box-containing protein